MCRLSVTVGASSASAREATTGSPASLLLLKVLLLAGAAMVLLHDSPSEMVTSGEAGSAGELSPGRATAGGSSTGTAAAGCCGAAGGGLSTGATGVRRKEVLMSAGEAKAACDSVSTAHRVSNIST